MTETVIHVKGNNVRVITDEPHIKEWLHNEHSNRFTKTFNNEDGIETDIYDIPHDEIDIRLT